MKPRSKSGLEKWFIERTRRASGCARHVITSPSFGPSSTEKFGDDIYHIQAVRPSLGPEQKLFSDMEEYHCYGSRCSTACRRKPFNAAGGCSGCRLCLASAVTKSETDNKVYELCGPDVISTQEKCLRCFCNMEEKSVVPKRAEERDGIAGRVAESIMENGSRNIRPYAHDVER